MERKHQRLARLVAGGTLTLGALVLAGAPAGAMQPTDPPPSRCVPYQSCPPPAPCVPREGCPR